MSRHKIRQLNLWISFFLVLSIFILFVVNFRLFVCLTSLYVLIYYWFEIGANLKECSSLNKLKMTLFIILGSLYALVSVISLFFGLFRLVVLVSTFAVSYFSFKLYWLTVKGFKNKEVKYVPSLLIIIVSASVGVITYTCFGKIYFGVLVAVLAIFYDSLYWITKAFLEKGNTNRKLE